MIAIRCTFGLMQRLYNFLISPSRAKSHFVTVLKAFHYASREITRIWDAFLLSAVKCGSIVSGFDSRASG